MYVYRFLDCTKSQVKIKVDPHAPASRNDRPVTPSPIWLLVVGMTAPILVLGVLRPLHRTNHVLSYAFIHGANCRRYQQQHNGK